MIEIEKISALMDLMNSKGFDTIRVSQGPENVYLSKSGPEMAAGALAGSPGSGVSNPSVPSSTVESGAPLQAPAPAVTSVAPPSGEALTSPFVGTFYQSVSPDTPPFVVVGDAVKKGQTLCIVEAMKLMNHIEAEWNGIVTAILVSNAKPVEFGTPLFLIQRAE